MADLVRYDRYGVEVINVNLVKGTVKGVWGGQSFSDTLKNIKNIHGSRDDDDTLIGDADDNRLIGGKKADVFVFNNALNKGVDRIKDFTNGVDLIRIEGALFCDLIIKKASGGADSKIILDSGPKIILEGVNKSGIEISDFDFI